MKVAVHLAHPAQYHLFKHVIDGLVARDHRVIVTYNHKDVLERLVHSRRLGSASVDLASRKPAAGLAGLVLQFLQKEVGFYRVMRRHRPDIVLGTSIVVAHVGWLLGIPSVIVNEDDFDIVAGTARIGYPFCSHIVTPACCRTGRWAAKVVSYEGYHELAYLAPSRFVPDRTRAGIPDDRPYFVLRFADLSAHHDVGRGGIDTSVASRLITHLKAHGRVVISSERELEPEFEPYRYSLDPARMHDALAFADLYIGDSQTMAAEAAVLGTPSLRYNDFVGQISYLEELEQRYGLTCGIPTTEPDRLLSTVQGLLALPDRRALWAQRRSAMLIDKIDVTAFLVWFIENYPQSVEEARSDAGVKEEFRLSGSLRI